MVRGESCKGWFYKNWPSDIKIVSSFKEHHVATSPLITHAFWALPTSLLPHPSVTVQTRLRPERASAQWLSLECAHSSSSPMRSRFLGYVYSAAYFSPLFVQEGITSRHCALKTLQFCIQTSNICFFWLNHILMSIRNERIC